MEYDIITDCTGFEWDAGNKDKNSRKHGVTRFECEQVFFNEPLLLFDDKKHTTGEKRHYVLGKTNTDRKLFVAFTIRNELIRIISARAMSRKERAYYEKT